MTDLQVAWSKVYLDTEMLSLVWIFPQRRDYAVAVVMVLLHQVHMTLQCYYGDGRERRTESLARWLRHKVC